MRMISYAVIVLMVFISIFTVDNYRVREVQLNQSNVYYMKKIINLAMEDCTEAFKTSGDIYQGTQSVLTDSKPTQAIDALMKTLALNLGYSQLSVKSNIQNYIPAIVLTVDDGYYLYGVDDIEIEGDEYTIPFIHTKKNYTYVNGDSYYFFRISGLHSIITFSETKDKWQMITGDCDTLSVQAKSESDRMFFSSTSVSNVIRQSMLTQIERDINLAIQKHLTYAASKGLHYNFSFLPKNNSWTGVVEEPGVLMLIQGLPLSPNKSFDYLASDYLGISLRDFIYGYTKNGVKYYSKDNCSNYTQDEIEEVFLSYGDAASSGYYPCHDCFGID